VVISGIAATAHADLQGHVLLAGSVDVTRRDIPLCLEHGRRIGEVTNLLYAGHDLYITAEITDDPVDPAIHKLGFLSICGKPVERAQRGDVYHVTKFICSEISLVKIPANSRCIVFERKAGSPDPMRKFARTKARELDLVIARVTCVGKMLKLLQERIA
jgi:hypothetical protein